MLNTSHVNSTLQSEITSAQYHPDGLTVALGMSNGLVLLYDLRSDKPLLIKENMNNLPIKDIVFADKRVISADANTIKIWDSVSGDAFTSIQPDGAVNSLCMYPNSGLLFAGVETFRIGAYYIPSLGVAPKWCSFLDNITEELEESKSTQIYEDYKFVTREELEELSLTNMIGTNMLRSYMHGFFMDIRLYTKVKAVADPFAYANYVKDTVNKKIEEKRANRISIPKKLPKVNADFAQSLLEGSNKKKKTTEADEPAPEIDAKNPLMDSRFSQMFSGILKFDLEIIIFRLSFSNRSLFTRISSSSCNGQT